MKKRNYRAQKVNEIQWEAVAQRVKDRAVVLAIDVAKVGQYGVLMDGERQAVVTVKWEHQGRRLSCLSGCVPYRADPSRW